MPVVDGMPDIFKKLLSCTWPQPTFSFSEVGGSMIQESWQRVPRWSSDKCDWTSLGVLMYKYNYKYTLYIAWYDFRILCHQKV